MTIGSFVEAPILKDNTIGSFAAIQAARDNLIWERMNSTTVQDYINTWITSLSYRTRINYQSGIRMLTLEGLLDPRISLQAFSQINHDAVIDRIKLVAGWKETTRQARAALYITFTRYLSRRFPGIVRKAIPCREGVEKTFYRVHEKVMTEAMNQAQWTEFFSALAEINSRDCLIGKICLQGGKRVREVLFMTVQQINWDNREITFSQSKTRGVKKETVITYPESVMKELKEYIRDRQGYVFISSKGNPVTLNQVTNTFAKAGQRAKVPFVVTPHVLRTSAVTYLKQQGFSTSDIQKITGHASSEMVNAYDKTDRADNATKKVSLIS